MKHTQEEKNFETKKKPVLNRCFLTEVQELHKMPVCDLLKTVITQPFLSNYGNLSFQNMTITAWTSSFILMRHANKQWLRHNERFFKILNDSFSSKIVSSNPILYPESLQSHAVPILVIFVLISTQAHVWIILSINVNYFRSEGMQLLLRM